MAIYEPTQIIPSTFTNCSTVAANDKVNIQWQVNGNSALEGFQVDMYVNNTQSTFLKSTGYLTAGCPFNGIDMRGKPVYFSYNPAKKWAEEFGLVDGGDYKFRITQWYKAQNSVVSALVSSLSKGSVYYLKIPEGNAYSGGVVYFAVNETFEVGTFYYSFTNGMGWFEIEEKELHRIVITTAGFNADGTIPENAISIESEPVYNANYNLTFVQQISESAFITRTTPTLEVTIENLNEGVLAASIASFTAKMEQAQGDSVKWVRWEIVNASDKETPLDDTLRVYTPILKYEYYGLHNKNAYAIRCTVETESGVVVTSGWIEFMVRYDQNSYTGKFSAERFDSENSVGLNWEPITTIPAKAVPGDGYSLSPINGTVVLNNNSSITWDSINGHIDEMNFEPPWVVACKIRLKSKKKTWTSLIFEGSTEEYDDGFLQELSFDTLEYSGYNYFNKFSPNGEWYIESIKNKCYAYRVLNNKMTYVAELGELAGSVSDYNLFEFCLFTPDSKVMVTDNGTIFSIEGNQMSYVGKLERPDKKKVSIGTADINPDGNMLVAHESYSDYSTNPPTSHDVTALYTINGTNINYVCDLEVGGQIDENYYNSCSFSPNGKLLLLCDEGIVGNNTITVYTVTANKITFLRNIQFDESSKIYQFKFSPDGKLLFVTIINGDIGSHLSTGRVEVFTVDNTDIKFLETINTGIVRNIAINNSSSLVCFYYPYANSTELKIYAINDNKFNIITTIKQSACLRSVNFDCADTIMILSYGTNMSNDSYGVYIYSVINGEITYSAEVDSGVLSVPIVTAISKDNILAINNKFTKLQVPSEYRYTGEKEFVGGKILRTALSESNADTASASFSGDKITVNATTILPAQPISIKVLVEYEYGDYIPNGRFFELNADDLSNNLLFYRDPERPNIDGRFIIYQAGKIIAEFSDNYNADTVVIIVSPTSVQGLFFSGNELIFEDAQSLTYTQPNINSITINGGIAGVEVENVAVFKGDKNVAGLYRNRKFEPTWNDLNYVLYMTANFNKNIEGGTGTSTGEFGFYLCRSEEGDNTLKVIAKTNSLTTSLKDFGIVSGKSYFYHLFAYDNNGALMSAATIDKPIKTRFKNYSILETKYNEEDEAYHVVKQFIFGCNISHGAVSNNNSPSVSANFTRYPTIMGSLQNYASGTLQALIGVVDTRNSYDYYDSIELEEELNNLSTSTNTLFLRDMKGHIRMIHTSGAISQETDHKTRQMQNKISLPWVEVGDASKATIIQLPTDEGSRVDLEVLEVELDVDLTTGQLIARYPLPYEGTIFSLSGPGKSVLVANTPNYTKPPTLELPRAGETDENKFGELTVKVSKK